MGTLQQVALLSPFHGGSHAYWAEALVEHSTHQIELLGLPDRFWKWRMRGAAITLARLYAELPRPSVILATDMLDVTTFLALTRWQAPPVPVVLYMHENQFTYPIAADRCGNPASVHPGHGNSEFGFVNLVSMLASDHVVFNSTFHRDELLQQLPRFLEAKPDHRELDCVEQVRDRSEVLYPGIRVDDLGPVRSAQPPVGPGAEPPLVLWNHRWEYDKNPTAFFDALVSAATAGVRFRVALCGEQPGGLPDAFAAGLESLGDRVVHTGFLPRSEYVDLLRKATVVVSTAWHEFYGISVLEAVAAGAIPLVPRRLSYPEVLPQSVHCRCLYSDGDDLARKLADLLRDPEPWHVATAGLAAQVRERHGWNRLASSYDTLLARATLLTT